MLDAVVDLLKTSCALFSMCMFGTKQFVIHNLIVFFFYKFIYMYNFIASPSVIFLYAHQKAYILWYSLYVH